MAWTQLKITPRFLTWVHYFSTCPLLSTSSLEEKPFLQWQTAPTSVISVFRRVRPQSYNTSKEQNHPSRPNLQGPRWKGCIVLSHQHPGNQLPCSEITSKRQLIFINMAEGISTVMTHHWSSPMTDLPCRTGVDPDTLMELIGLHTCLKLSTSMFAEPGTKESVDNPFKKYHTRTTGFK